MDFPSKAIIEKSSTIIHHNQSKEKVNISIQREKLATISNIKKDLVFSVKLSKRSKLSMTQEKKSDCDEGNIENREVSLFKAQQKKSSANTKEANLFNQITNCNGDEPTQKFSVFNQISNGEEATQKFNLSRCQQEKQNSVPPDQICKGKGVVEPSNNNMEQMDVDQRASYAKQTFEFMKLALDQANDALANLEVPVGCVIVEDGEVIASGRNRTTETRNATRHAEMEAIDFLVEQWQKNGLSPLEVSERFSKCILYVTCEPCIMCAAALSYLGIKEAYYGCGNDKFGGCGSILSLHTSCTELPASEFASSKKGFKCTGGIMASEAISLLRSFYEQGNPNAPKPHRPLKQQV